MSFGQVVWTTEELKCRRRRALMTAAAVNCYWHTSTRWPLT
jgi:hypothetical protein